MANESKIQIAQDSSSPSSASDLQRTSDYTSRPENLQTLAPCSPSARLDSDANASNSTTRFFSTGTDGGGKALGGAGGAVGLNRSENAGNSDSPDSTGSAGSPDSPDSPVSPVSPNSSGRSGSSDRPARSSDSGSSGSPSNHGGPESLNGAVSDSKKSFIQPGQLIGGRYQAIKFLGRGGMGEVWLAAELNQGIKIQEVVLKLVPPALQQNEKELEKIQSNFELIRKLRHPNICSALTFAQDETHGYFLVMDYVPGIELSDFQ